VFFNFVRGDFINIFLNNLYPSFLFTCGWGGVNRNRVYCLFVFRLVGPLPGCRWSLGVRGTLGVGGVMVPLAVGVSLGVCQGVGNVRSLPEKEETPWENPTMWVAAPPPPRFLLLTPSFPKTHIDLNPNHPEPI